jgi:hypothetical protein
MKYQGKGKLPDTAALVDSAAKDRRKIGENYFSSRNSRSHV